VVIAISGMAVAGNVVRYMQSPGPAEVPIAATTEALAVALIAVTAAAGVRTKR
jgi:hypothetical protein